MKFRCKNENIKNMKLKHSVAREKVTYRIARNSCWCWGCAAWNGKSRKCGTQQFRKHDKGKAETKMSVVRWYVVVCSKEILKQDLPLWSNRHTSGIGDAASPTPMPLTPPRISSMTLYYPLYSSLRHL
jgi:hypothetical protein